MFGKLLLELLFLRYCNWSSRIRAFDITVVPFVVLRAVLGSHTDMRWPSLPGVEGTFQLDMHRGIGLDFLQASFAHGLSWTWMCLEPFVS
jgi:hypothetical protein